MNNKQLSIFLAILAILSIIFTHCKEDNLTDLGSDLVGKNEKLNALFIDTISVKAYTQFVYKIQTDNAKYTTLGSYIDPIFGETRASFVTQLLISNSEKINKEATEDDVTPDSLVINLIYPNEGLQVYGYDNKDCKISVNKINQYIESQPYYSDYKIDDLNLTNQHTITFNPRKIIDNAELVAKKKRQDLIDKALENNEDTSKIKKVEPKATISIKIADDLCKEIHSALKQSIRNNATFVELFNGFCFSQSTGVQSSAISILDYAKSEIILYYHDKKESKKYYFAFNRYATHFNVFEHGFSKGNILSEASTQNSKLDTVIYLQGLGGVNARLKFPAIKQMASQGKWAVSKAELVFTVPNKGIEESQYPAPSELILYRIDKQNKLYKLQELTAKGNVYLGEKYSKNQYSFNITMFIQKQLQGDLQDNDLLIGIKNNEINPARVVIGANNNSKTIKLKLIASKL